MSGQKKKLRAALLAASEALEEADDLLHIAWSALYKLGLYGCGSDACLSHEVRMFALEFTEESRDARGAVCGTGRTRKCLRSIRDVCAAIAKVEASS